MARVLIVDDDVQLCKAVGLVISKMGHEVENANTLAKGSKLADTGRFDLVILDIRLPDGNGLEALPRYREAPNRPEVIILSGSGDPDGAELAIRSGAYSYITKPPTLKKIQLPVLRAIEYHRKKQTTSKPFVLKRDAIVGQSRSVMRCLDIVAQAAGTDSGVLITGETGTGKELFARAIHENSRRANGPFVVVDCAALPETLVESILFGHERGAYTGADKPSQGLVRQANGGTLFLDEVGELPMTMQKAFLRVLQDKRFRPVGGVREVDSDFRLLAATNKDLDEMVLVWKFRQDLLFRLKTIDLELPPLRERGGDAKLLAQHFVEEICRKNTIPRKGFSPEFLEALEAYPWPGNVRELANAMESALAASAGDPILYPRHLPVDIRAHLARIPLEQRRKETLAPEPSRPRGPAAPELDEDEGFPSLKDYRNQAVSKAEREYLEKLMAATGWDVKQSCRLSGLSRPRLYALLKQYDLSRPRDNDDPLVS